ncbi:MAG: FoF1 ATP synthase subunit gamma [Candidatus Woykebacteria bacterium]
MSSRNELKADLEAVSAIKSITSVYQEIASFRMKQLRGRVDAVREFLEGISTVYNHAKSAYIAAVKSRSPKERENLWKRLSFIRRNGKKVNVLLSANEHLYGTLILDVWSHYLKDLKRGDADAAVVGSIGKYLLSNEQTKVMANYFSLDDDKPKPEEVKKIIDHITSYEQVVIYHGQMVTVLHQIPVRSEISGGVSFEVTDQRSARRYLFEPSPEKIMEFFETEIMAALFNQTILEHQLSRFAARMVAMDQATENAQEEVKKIEKQILRLRRRVMNRKQLEVFAGFSLWRKEAGPWK